ncbi:hypothetical protein BCR44DRAFT_1436413 [Catenaria anguillulae PL171]|uniref:Uncharacterized protein n=1 Tax=Catenaria anguillulae PL171 TaxID=765915 RepID=A0A1Y2HK02_9FUNG|nr:hypothetical protein BCR44DRAFT_1436413 [Catenaria anguillulae PL171]
MAYSTAANSAPDRASCSRNTSCSASRTRRASMASLRSKSSFLATSDSASKSMSRTSLVLTMSVTSMVMARMGMGDMDMSGIEAGNLLADDKDETTVVDSVNKGAGTSMASCSSTSMKWLTAWNDMARNPARIGLKGMVAVRSLFMGT